MSNTPFFVHIGKKPTFDVVDVCLEHVDIENGLAYFSSQKVFKFDGVFGNLENRSRVLRIGKPENEYVVHIISATIDAGFCGHLVWKVQLTQKGVELVQVQTDKNVIANLFSGCQQIHLFPSPAGNYYNGTNQTGLEPDIIFGL